ncbi:hypothetical protein [Lysinibacillus boronitolerans]|uniref:hypothetical protein n=1 Tax=Lysinibacillus boronitolerans TaxID=309788 RepID=UPI0002E85E7E|nr:hypothetical protein [Lysinibacillus boronitolerans]
MLVKYDLQIYVSKKNVIFMFTMDHDVEFVENFVGGFYGVDQFKRIRGLVTGVYVSDNLKGKYYDCNKWEDLLRPKIIGADREFAIAGDNFVFKFRIDDYNLNKVDYEVFVNVMEKFKMGYNNDYLMLVFCSAQDEVNRARYSGGLGIRDIYFNK